MQVNAGELKYFIYEPLFRNHLLPPFHDGAVFNNAEQSVWPPVVLFLMVLLLVVLKVTAPARTLRVINAAYSLQVARQIEREDYSPFKRVSVLLSIVFVLSTAFLFFKLNQLYGSVLQGNSSLFQYLFFVVIIIIAYTIKFMVMNIISFLTGASTLFNEYIINTLIINQTAGLLLLPVMVLCELSPLNPAWLVLPSMLFLVLTYLVRLYRGFLFAGLEQGVGILQLFIYLCALEILPLLVLIKFLIVKF